MSVNDVSRIVNDASRVISEWHHLEREHHSRIINMILEVSVDDQNIFFCTGHWSKSKQCLEELTFPYLNIGLCRENLRGKYHCTIDLLFDWFELVCFAKKIVSCHTADSKPIKQEINGTVILRPLVFLAWDEKRVRMKSSNYIAASGKTLRLVDVHLLRPLRGLSLYF